MKKLFILLFLFSAQLFFAQNKAKTVQAMYRQFDFWLGKWDVCKYGNDTIIAKSFIESIIDSVGLQENYSVLNNTYKGKSLNKYNPAKKRWEQFWIDNSGLTLFLTGGLVNGKMILDDKLTGNPKQGINQIVWEKLLDGSVRQTWNLSKDGGKTWSVLFDGLYKRGIQ
jgi:hypothetical protein